MGCCAWCAMCSISLVGLGSMRVVMLFGLSSIRRRRSWVGSSPPYRPYLPPHTLPLVWAKFRYLAVGGGSEIWADGIRIQDCYFLEAKHVGNPTSSPFVPGSNFPAFLQPGVDADIIGEVTRYTAIINDPSTPMVGLEIITNDARAVPYFQGFLGALPNGRVVVRP